MPTVAELAQQELSRRYSLQGRTQVAPRVQTMQNARPTVRSALSNLMRDAVDATGLEGGYRQGLLNAAQGIQTAADFLPVVGDVLGLEDASRAYGQGDMVGAGINMLGAVPVVGDVAAKAARSSLRNIYHGTSPDAAKAIDQFGFDLGKTADGSAWFTTNPDIGEVAAAGKGGVIQRQLDESNLKLASYDETDKYLKDQLIDMGYDGAYYPDAQDGSTHYEIWNQDKLNKLSPLSGLDMNPEARMQRAKDLGFDLDNVFYHGTASDFAELQPSTVGDLGGGVYVTPNPEKASGYAAVRKFMKRQTNNAGPNVLPLRVKSNLNYLDLQGSSIMPFDETRIQSLKDQGYEGIRQFDTEGNVIQMNIFDPKNIRSTNAEFDPAKADSADLLSSVGTTSALRGIA